MKKSITQKYPAKAESILSSCFVIKPATNNKLEYCEAKDVLWDTGATNTIISRNIADALGLEPIQKAMIAGIGGNKELAPDLSRSTTGYQLIKYLTEEKYDANKASTNDMPLFRLAEVLLNYAEAKAELGTLKQDDLNKTIKPLRSRAGLPELDMEEANENPDPYLSSPETGYANVTGANKGVILEIRRERTLETPMEGLRYWDIMRWKEGKRFEKPIEGLYFAGTGEYDLDGNGTVDVCIYDSETAPGNKVDVLYLKLGTDIVLSGKTSGNLLAHSTTHRIWNEERDYLYPIPTDDRVLTQGAISQNPGWDDGLPF